VETAVSVYEEERLGSNKLGARVDAAHPVDDSPTNPTLMGAIVIEMGGKTERTSFYLHLTTHYKWRPPSSAVWCLHPVGRQAE
jgi:hypothetical protein